MRGSFQLLLMGQREGARTEFKQKLQVKYNTNTIGIVVCAVRRTLLSTPCMW